MPVISRKKPTIRTKNTRRRYVKQIAELRKFDIEERFEGAHIIQENIYEQFIHDVMKKRFRSMEDIVDTAKQLNTEVIKYSRKHTRWFA